MLGEDCWNRLDEINHIVFPHGSGLGKCDLRVENINSFFQDFFIVDEGYRGKRVSKVGEVKKRAFATLRGLTEIHRPVPAHQSNLSS